MKLTKEELNTRMNRFRKLMDERHPDWKVAVIFTNIHLFYFTGTMQNGMLYIDRDQEATFWVYRSYERALLESPFENIQQMTSYRDAATTYEGVPESVYIETEKIPMGFYQRFNKYFPFKQVHSLDSVMGELRAVKSPYEVSCIEKAGEIHRFVMEEKVPSLLYEGMSESDLAIEIYKALVKEGHHGISRIGMFDTEMLLGHVGFGDSSIYPTAFNGPGGNLGISAAVPLNGNPNRKLKKGDLVFVDIGCGYEGYHTDKTMVYAFGKQPDFVYRMHEQCVRIQNQIVQELKPGAIPEEIYKHVMGSIEKDFLENFMGFGSRTVNFLGHGIGLWIDEVPVIAMGFKEPMKENMVFALEPKKGIPGVGMVGIENTYVVKSEGAACVTGLKHDIVLIET